MSIGIGVIGAGVMGTAHLEAVDGHASHARLVAVCDPDPARAASAAARFGVSALGDPLALIGSESVDAVVVASPDETHSHYVGACLRAGKPVLCEKPLAPTSAECRTLLDLEATTRPGLVQVGFMRRFDARYQELKLAYDSGAIGKALLVRCIHRNARAPGFFRPGMAITNAMVHEFDICRWLLGAEVRRIRVDLLPAAGPDHDRPGDPLLATLETSEGQIVSIEVFMNAGYGYDIRTEVVGSDGVLVMGHPPHGTLITTSGHALPFPTDFIARFADAYRLQVRAWVDGIRENRPVGASSKDGLHAALIAEAGVKALETGAWVVVEEVC